MEKNQYGNYLRELRKKHKLSQKQVASHLHIERPTYSHYENGRINPPLESLISLSKLYHISLEEILLNNNHFHSLQNHFHTDSSDDISKHLTKFSSVSLFYEPASIDEEIKLLHFFRPLTSAQKLEVIHFIEYLGKHKPELELE